MKMYAKIKREGHYRRFKKETTYDVVIDQNQSINEQSRVALNNYFIIRVYMRFSIGYLNNWVATPDY